MKTKRLFVKSTLLIILFLFGSFSMNSCRRARYKRMVRKRHSVNKKSKKHKGKYQKKLKKRTISTNSKYTIKDKRNYRRRPWYNK